LFFGISNEPGLQDNMTNSVIKKIVLFIFFGIVVSGCALEDDPSVTDKKDIAKPVLTEITAISTLSSNTKPNYTFNSTEDGTITYSGSCTSTTTSSVSGNNTLTLNTLSDGTYSDCTISVTDESGNISSVLLITTFTIDTTTPTISEVTVVTNPTNDSTPNYTFSSSELGTITYGGSCSSSTTSATSGNNNITLNTLSEGTYSNCTITVTDEIGFVSSSLTITSFEVDLTVPTIAEVTEVDSPTTDSTPSYTFSSDTVGTITYGGPCTSSDTSVISGNNTITLTSLSDGTYSDCTITVTDVASNSVTLNMSSFTIDTTAPTIVEVTAVTTPSLVIDPSYTFSSNEAGSITYGGSCSSITTTVVSGNNTITLVSLSSGTYSDCTVTITDDVGNVSSTLTLTSFSIVVDQMGGSIQGVELSLTTVVSTLAGSDYPQSSNGIGTNANFHSPNGITTDGTNLYVADTSNHRIRKIVISTGVVTTLAGWDYGYSDGAGTSGYGSESSFRNPSGITTDGTNLYVSDTYNHLIRQVVISSRVVTTIAGTGSSGSSNGTGTSSSFNTPYGITTDGTNLYVADRNNNQIRKIVISTGVVTTLAGTGSSGSSNGTGTSARFYYPWGITTDGTNLYVVDNSNRLIRKIVISTGVVTTIAGSGTCSSTDGTGQESTFCGTQDITTDGTNLYVADGNKIRRIVISTGVVTTIAGSGSAGGVNGTGSSSSFWGTKGITTDGTNLYVADGNKIRKIE
jgi:large repetitive protein